MQDVCFGILVQKIVASYPYCVCWLVACFDEKLTEQAVVVPVEIQTAAA